MDEISPTTSPETFHDQYIKQRKAVKLTGFPAALSHCRESWSNTALVELVGSETKVMVERRKQKGQVVDSDSDNLPAYGQGGAKWMEFSEFVEKGIERKNLNGDDDGYYMTTQPLDKRQYSDSNGDNDENDENDQPLIIPPNLSPLFHLEPSSSDSRIPLHLPLIPNLVLMTSNLWFGSSSSSQNETSSGLHHDYHDNVYLVVR